MTATSHHSPRPRNCKGLEIIPLGLSQLCRNVSFAPTCHDCLRCVDSRKQADCKAIHSLCHVGIRDDSLLTRSRLLDANGGQMLRVWVLAVRYRCRCVPSPPPPTQLCLCHFPFCRTFLAQQNTFCHDGRRYGRHAYTCTQLRRRHDALQRKLFALWIEVVRHCQCSGHR